MNKKIKIISTILMVLMVAITLTTTVSATGAPIGTHTTQSTTDAGVGSVLEGLKNPGAVQGTDKITDIGKTIVGIFQIIGIVVAVVVLLVLGIKYMMGSAQEKAEYKKTMIPYLIGALLIFGATTIVNVVYSVFSGI